MNGKAKIGLLAVLATGTMLAAGLAVAVGCSSGGASLESINLPPTVSKQPATQTAYLGRMYRQDLSVFGPKFTDPNREPLALSFEFTPPTCGLYFDGNGAILGTPNLLGPITVKVTARDPKQSETSCTFTITSVTPPTAGVPNIPPISYQYTDSAAALPAYYTDRSSLTSTGNFDNTPLNNPITDAGATLGRVLFYDVRLSVDDTVSCASCHKQTLGFADDRVHSVGVNGQFTPLHGTGLTNARYYPNGKFFADERAGTLEEQVLMPIQNTVEMGLPIPQLVTKLSQTPFYGQLFGQAFGTPDVTSNRIALALAQFIRAMVSFRSKFDMGRTAGPGGTADFAAIFTPSEMAGMELFMNKPDAPVKPGMGCATCHESESMASIQARDNGLPVPAIPSGPPPAPGVPVPGIPTAGAYGNGGGGTIVDGVITKSEGVIKTPSLRNIAVRAPFMRDGRFATLGEVVDHYAQGVAESSSLDPSMRDSHGKVIRHTLTPAQKQSVIDFLGTLTDPFFLTDPRFSDPFK